MNAVDMLATQPVVQSVGWTLIHFLWQGTVLAVAYQVAAWLCRAGSANTRYALGVITLLLMAIAPAVTLFIVHGGQPWFTTGDAARTVDWGLSVGGADAGYPSALATAMPWLVGAWLIGVCALALRFCGGWWRIQALRHTGIERAPAWIERLVARLAAEMRVPVPVQVLLSRVVDTPTVIGWLRPAILLPASVITGLTPQQLEMVIAHELGHVRRFDYLVNLAQVLLETVLFYHPAVRWVSERVRHERENCCDDIALAQLGDAVGYARALAALEAERSRGPGRLALAATGGSLVVRIRRLFGERRAQLGHARASWIAVLGAVMVLAVATLAVRPLWLSPTETDDGDVAVVEMSDDDAADEAADGPAVRETLPELRALLDDAPAARPGPEISDRGLASDMERAARSIQGPDELPRPQVRVARTPPPLVQPAQPAAEPAVTAPETQREPPPVQKPLPETVETAANDTGVVGGIELVRRELPEAVFTPAPDYPAAAARRGIIGAVTAGFRVNIDGSVSDVEIIGSVGGELFQEEVTRTLLSWRFEPPADGRDIGAVQTFHFRPTEESVAARECAVTGSRLCRQRRAWVTETERMNVRVLSGGHADAQTQRTTPQYFGTGGR